MSVADTATITAHNFQWQGEKLKVFDPLLKPFLRRMFQNDKRDFIKAFYLTLLKLKEERVSFKEKLFIF